MKLQNLRRVELIQRATLGGHPTSNQDGVFTHGEAVYVVSQRQLIALFYELRPLATEKRLQDILDSVLRDDHFLVRSAAEVDDRYPDLPEHTALEVAEALHALGPNAAAAEVAAFHRSKEH